MLRAPATIVAAAASLCLSLGIGNGQSTSSVPSPDRDSDQGGLAAVISGPEDVPVNRTVVLDGSPSHGVGENPEYRWYIDDPRQSISRNIQLIYTSEKSGKIVFHLLVRSVGLDGKLQESTAEHAVVVYRRKLLLLADATVSEEKLFEHEARALDLGVYLKIIKTPAATPLISSEDTLFTLLSEQKTALSNAEATIVWTDGISGLQALVRSVQGDSERQDALRNQTVVLLTGQGLSPLSRTVRGSYQLLKPQQMYITRREAFNPLIEAGSIEEFQKTIELRDIDFHVLNQTNTQLKPWDILSALVNYMLTHGISSQTVILLLMLPVIATILAFLKQIVGITTFGLYTPSIIALSFLALGWKVGILFLLFIIGSGYLARSLVRPWRLLYIPKMAIILTVVSFMLIILLSIGAFFGFLGVPLSRDTVFILLIMSTLAENFLNLKSEEGLTAALIGIGETLLGSLLCVFIVQWPLLQSTILAYPELVLITLALNMFLGRWTGLRLVEYFRFREVFKHLQEE